MKRLLYIAPVIIDLNKLDGVSKKILNHCIIFCKFYSVELISYGPDCLYYFYEDTIETVALGRLNKRLKLYSYIKHKLVYNNYDYIYIRHHFSGFLFLNILRLLNKNKNKLVLEIPTYPYRYGFLKKKKEIVSYLVYIISIFFLKFYIDRIVTYSNSSKIFGIKTIKTINGVIYDDILPKQKQVRVSNQDEINLISVSSHKFFDGFDRLIEGLKYYYNQGGKVNIIYHLVGEGEEVQNYKKLVVKYGIEKHIVFYGFISSQALDAVYNKADIAIESIGIHRIGLKINSSIKSKEYAAKGLPIVSSYRIDAFSHADNKKFVHLISADETSVNIHELIRFYNKMYHSTISNVTVEIRNASRKRSDMVITLQKVMNYFNEIC